MSETTKYKIRLILNIYSELSTMFCMKLAKQYSYNADDLYNIWYNDNEDDFFDTVTSDDLLLLNKAWKSFRKLTYNTIRNNLWIRKSIGERINRVQKAINKLKEYSSK